MLGEITTSGQRLYFQSWGRLDKDEWDAESHYEVKAPRTIKSWWVSEGAGGREEAKISTKKENAELKADFCLYVGKSTGQRGECSPNAR